MGLAGAKSLIRDESDIVTKEMVDKLPHQVSHRVETVV